MSREIITRALERISPFAGIDTAVLARMAQFTRIVRMPAGTAVFHAGDPADRFFVLLAGEVGIYPGNPGGSPAGIVQAGEVFGTESFLDAASRPATAVTLKESLLLYVVRHDFDRFLTMHPGLNLALNARLRHADACARVLVQQPPAGAPLPDELYYKEYTCPCCGEEIRSPAVKSRFIRVARTDSDFCQHHVGPNPLFYEIVVCPACGYAFNEESYEPLNPQTQKALRAACAGQGRRIADPTRTLDEAIELFKLAIACQEARGARPSVLGRFHLKLAWLYRFREDAVNEQDALASAVRCFTQAFQLEQAGDPKQELHLLYLLGELNRRLGNRDAAVRWFSRVINHPEKSRNPLAVNMAREQWQEIRGQKTRPV